MLASINDAPEYKLPSSLSFNADQNEKIVAEALEKKGWNSIQIYQMIVQDIEDHVRLTSWFNLLCKNVVLIKESCKELISAILSFNWFLDHRDSVFEAYLRLVINLNQAHNGSLLIPTYTFICKAFRGPKSNVSDEDFGYVFSKIHELTAFLLKSFPISSTLLKNTLADSCPHVIFDTQIQSFYLKNSLAVLGYCPQLTQDVIGLIIDKLVQIDVEIYRGCNQISPQYDQNKSCILENESEKEESLKKIDLMLNEFLIWINKQSVETRCSVFNSLISSFDKFILLTNETRYTQWIWFYYCGINEDYAYEFLNHLYQFVVSNSLSPLNLQRVIMFFASFTARAAYLSEVTLQRSLCLMIEWLESYLCIHKDQQPDAQKHLIFYALFQGVCYILIYAHERIFENFGPSEMMGLHLERFVESTLNPLKVCSPVLVDSFLSIIRIYGVNFDHIVEKNTQVILPPNLLFGGENSLLQTYPFDPYLLPITSGFLTGMYIYPEQTLSDKESLARVKYELE